MNLTDIGTLQGRDELWSTVIIGNTRFTDTDLRLRTGFCKHDLAPLGRVQTLHSIPTVESKQLS